MPPARLLLVEDTLSLATLYREFLRDEGHEIQHVGTLARARAALEAGAPDAVLLDLRLPDGDGLGLLAEIRARPDPPPVIVMTAHGSVATAVEAMRAGASDFLVKPFAAERLVVTLANVLERAALKRTVASLAAGAQRGGLAGFIGAAPAMQAVYRIIENAAASRATVFVTGESGTGKELAAEAALAQAARAAGPFVPLNCAALPKDLIESEIFGHVRGAFTGAVADRPGAARAADGGTLFLDEICEMDLALQGKLLRFIQTGSFVPVGGTKALHTDVRFVCATNRDPLAEVQAGRFREDLYYRLHVVPVPLPPLRERGEDVMLLAEAFLTRSAAEEGKRFTRFAPDAAALLRAHRWPGNVRELENAIRTAVVLHDGEAVTAAMLPVTVHGGAAPAPSVPAPRAPDPARRIRPLAEIEREAIEEAIRLCGGNVPKAAAFLGVSPSTLYRKREAWAQRG